MGRVGCPGGLRLHGAGLELVVDGRHDDCVESYCVALMAQKDVLVRGIMKPPVQEPKTEDEAHWREYEQWVEGHDDDNEDPDWE